LIGQVTAKNSTKDEFVFNSTKVPVLELKGTPYERGFQHGKQMKDAIAEVFKKWKASVQKDTNKDADVVIADFLASTNFKSAILKWTPELWKEIEGIAAGSGQKFEDVLAFQLIDEYWGYLDRLKHGSVDKDHCSAVGVAATKEHPTFVAQNVDIDTYMHGYQVLLHIAETEDTPEQYVMSCAGFIGFVGMNNKNVGVVINALTDLNNSVEGLPVTFVTRGLLSKNSGKKAIEFVENVKHASGQNYIIGTQEEVVNFEASANEVVTFNPVADKKIVYHTNHSLANHDVKPWMQDYHDMVLSGSGRQTNSTTRFEALERRLTGSGVWPTPEVVKATLRSKDSERYPVCVSYDSKAYGYTFSSVLFTIGDKPSVQVTYGSPDQSDYQEHFFRTIQ
jgi:isopenicillin-N N-acyltransferase like protein